MKLMYIGYAIDKESCDKQIGASVAGNNMQIGLLNKLCKNLGENLEILSVYPTASFPNEKKILFRRKGIKITDYINGTLISFINVPFIKQFTQSISVFKEAKKIIKKDNQVKILTFNANPSISIPVIILKKLYKVELICLLADPPVDIKKRYGIDKVIKNIFWKIIEKSLLMYDKIIALNKKAVEIYTQNKPYIIIDGAIDIKDFEIVTTVENKSKKKIVLFSGALTEYNGINELVESTRYIHDENIEIHIYGDGPLRDFVEKKSKQILSLQYKGVVSNYQVKKFQKYADLLINPRRIDDLISQVTFPSKMIEYMISGTPVLSTKLNGLTEEYLENIYIIDDISPEKLATDIKDVLSLSNNKLNKKSEASMRFILNKKTWDIQGEKIYKFIFASK